MKSKEPHEPGVRARARPCICAGRAARDAGHASAERVLGGAGGVGHAAEADGGAFVVRVVVFGVGYSGGQVFVGDLVPGVEELAVGDFEFDNDLVDVEGEEDEGDGEGGRDTNWTRVSDTAGRWVGRERGLHKYADTSPNGQSTSPDSSFLGKMSIWIARKLLMNERGSC